jgi:hypothetical protein
MRTRLSASGLLIIVSVVFISVAVLALSWPRLRASVRYLPVDIAIDRYFADRQIPTGRLPVLIRFAGEAIRHNDHYRFHDGLGFLHYLRAVDVNTPAQERRGEYRLSEAETIETLRLAPAQPAAWLRLASLRWVLHDEPDSIIQPWKMSIFTGRTDSALLAQRVELGLGYWQSLDDEGLAMLRDQMLLAWRLQPGSLMRVLSSRDRQLRLTRELIEHTDPLALAEIEAWLEKIH